MRFADSASAPGKERFTPTVMVFSSARASRGFQAAMMAVATVEETTVRRLIGCLIMIAPRFLRHCVHGHLGRFAGYLQRVCNSCAKQVRAKRTPSRPARGLFRNGTKVGDRSSKAPYSAAMGAGPCYGGIGIFLRVMRPGYVMEPG